MAKRKSNLRLKERIRRSSEFGALLKRYRLVRDATLKEVGDLVGRSPSFIQKIEAGDRGHDFTRDEVWKIIAHLKIWPPESDDVLRNAGFSADRTGAEEREIQTKMEFDEIWVFARQILDPETEWYDVVASNLKNNRRHCYFTADGQRFSRLRRALQSDLANHGQKSDAILKKNLECFVLPEELFLSNFALYIPKKRDLDRESAPEMSRIYGCGTKPVRGRADLFFTMSADEAESLFKILQKWRDCIVAGDDIVFRSIVQLYPASSEVKFVSTGASRNDV